MEIYALLDEDRRPRYVGAAKSAVSRRQSHWYQRRKKQTPVAVWLRSLSAPPEVWLIQDVERRDAWRAETYWIELLRQTGADLLNISTRMGLTPTSGALMSAETREKIAQAMRGRRHSGYLTGETNPASKLTAEKVKAIRMSTGSVREVGRQFGVSRQTVSDIRRGISWGKIN